MALVFHSRSTHPRRQSPRLVRGEVKERGRRVGQAGDQAAQRR